MNEDEPPRPVAKTRVYKKPMLRIYGQVRELTGSLSGTKNGDAGTMMT